MWTITNNIVGRKSELYINRKFPLLHITSLRARVTVTDLEDLQTLMRANIQENQALLSSGSIAAKVLKWFVLISISCNY